MDVRIAVELELEGESEEIRIETKPTNASVGENRVIFKAASLKEESNGSLSITISGIKGK